MTGEAAIRIHEDSIIKESIYGKRVRSTDVILTGIIYGCASLSMLLLIGILGYTFVRGVPHVTWSFLSTVSSATKGTFGILGNIINTLYIVVITLLIATPIGVGSAVYLNEYAKPGKIVRLIVFTTETLSGIPSIVYGLFGMLFFVNTLKWGFSVLAGAFTLSIMILPLIMRQTEEALKAVPDSYREASFGLGAGKLRTIFTIVLPSAVPGILAGVILAIGRIVGETAALIYTAGTVPGIPTTKLAGVPIFDMMSSGRTLAIHMYALLNEGLYMEQAYATAVVLLVMVLLINALSAFIAKKFTRS